MLVSAITMNSNNGYTMSNAIPVKMKDAIGDTSFNSLTPYVTRKTSEQVHMPQVFDSINEWQRFCHKRILAGKLDIIA